MAVVYYTGDEEEDKRQAEEPRLGGESAVIASAGGSPRNNPQATGGQYTDLQKYIQANRGSSFGQDYTNRISGELDKSQNVQQQAGSEFESQVEGGRNKYDEGLASEVASNPLGVSRDAEKKKKVNRLLYGDYTGPQSFADSDQFRKAYDATQEAVNIGKAADNESGRNSLLKKFYERPDYTSGMQALDNALLGGSAAFKQALPSIQSKTKQVGKGYEDLLRAMGKRISDAKAEDVATNEKALGLFGITPNRTVATTPVVQPPSSAPVNQQPVPISLPTVVETGGTLPDQTAPLLPPQEPAPEPEPATPLLPSLLQDAQQSGYTPVEQAKYAALAELAGIPNTQFGMEKVFTGDAWKNASDIRNWTQEERDNFPRVSPVRGRDANGPFAKINGEKVYLAAGTSGNAMGAFGGVVPGRLFGMPEIPAVLMDRDGRVWGRAPDGDTWKVLVQMKG